MVRANSDSSWRGRIPFVLLFGIETSIELFQAKLSRSAVRCLQGKQFDLEQVDVEEMFLSLHRDSSGLYLGPALSGVLLDRQKDYIQSPLAFIQALKVSLAIILISEIIAKEARVCIHDPLLLQSVEPIPSSRKSRRVMATRV